MLAGATFFCQPALTMPETIIEVRVHPGARKDEVLGFQRDTLGVRVTARPEKGQANEAVVRVLADAFGIAKGRIKIVRGLGSRNKLIALEGLSGDEVRKKLLRPESPGI